MIQLVFLSSLFLAVNGAPAGSDLGDLLFPWPFCASTTTVTLSGTFTVTSTSTVTSATSVVTATAIPSVTVAKVNTTIYSATAISCMSTAKTLRPYPAPLITLGVRAEASSATVATAAADCPTVPPVTIIPPSITPGPCTCITGSYNVITDTVTRTKTGVSTTTTTPVTTLTVTETWILPTPTAYKGVNYYQYLNKYVYPYGAGGCATCGFGGGGYETSDWNGNYSYYTSGLTQNINFESANYLNWNTITCQLPGQAKATDCSQWTVVFQGFIHATQTGKYTVAPYSVTDNALFFWGGDKAYSAYANGNVDGGVSYTQPSGVPTTFDFNLVAGEFFPITFIYVNGYGPGKTLVTITEPNGTTYPNDLNLFVPPCPNSAFIP